MSKTSWIIEETKGLKLGDKRLEKRLGDLIKKLSNSSSNSIPRSCGGLERNDSSLPFF